MMNFLFMFKSALIFLVLLSGSCRSVLSGAVSNGNSSAQLEAILENYVIADFEVEDGALELEKSLANMESEINAFYAGRGSDIRISIKIETGIQELNGFTIKRARADQILKVVSVLSDSEMTLDGMSVILTPLHPWAWEE